MQNSPDPRPTLPATALVSSIAGHELNNVALTMQGFIDLAAEDGPLSDPVQRCFQELRIGIARITALAGELDSLGNPSGASKRIAIGALVPHAQWRCDPTHIVVVDPYHARAAILALTRLAGKPPPGASPALLTISREIASQTPCAACGGPGAHAVPQLRLQVEARVARGDTRHPDHTARRLTLAVLLHSAHMAGGHVEIDDSAQLLSLTLPAD